MQASYEFLGIPYTCGELSAANRFRINFRTLEHGLVPRLSLISSPDFNETSFPYERGIRDRTRTLGTMELTSLTALLASLMLAG